MAHLAAHDKPYDTVVIGSGPAGYTAALYAARANLKTLVLQGFESGGQLMLTSDVENFPGYRDGVEGPDMMDELEAQAARFGAEMIPENVERVDFSERPFKLWAEGEEEPVLAKAVVIATGAKAKWLGLEKEQHLMGKGVSGCATCDGFFFGERGSRSSAAATRRWRRRSSSPGMPRRSSSSTAAASSGRRRSCSSGPGTTRR